MKRCRHHQPQQCCRWQRRGRENLPRKPLCSDRRIRLLSSAARPPILSLLILLVINSTVFNVIGVTGLPRNNDNKNSKCSSDNDNNVISQRRSSNNFFGGRTAASQRSSIVTLKDEFPCGEFAAPSLSTASGNNGEAHNNHQSASTATTTSSRVSFSFTGNSFAEQNNIHVDYSKQSSLGTRGGESTEIMNDDEIDQMIEDLIAGLDDDGDDHDVIEDLGKSDEQIIASVDENDDETIDAAQVKTSAEEGMSHNDDSSGDGVTDGSSTSSNNSNSLGSKPTRVQPFFPSKNNENNNNRPSLPLSTPTNAYYRFLVRRGPKGHFLASFTLISIQWIKIYIPLLYKSVASILLKLHVYDPNVLWQRDRQSREEEERRRRGIYPPKKKGGVLGLFQTNSQQKKERDAQQQRADLLASKKLKQLYKAIKSGDGSGGALSEVKYRYLSAAFRRKHGLGKEYRVEKPMSFMGEVVEGDAHQRVLTEEAVDDVVFSDGEEADGEEGSKMTPKQQIKKKRNRKKLTDWVVQAYRKPPSRSLVSSGKDQLFESSLWQTVEHSAIAQAAWESRSAEQWAWQKKRSTKQRGSDSAKGGKGDDEYDGEDEEPLADIIGTSGKSNGYGYGASKMLQSVMTRVGTNGRLPGAYPMDAPPIEECANNRGVIDYARRYGYGTWKYNNGHDGENSDEGDESFGGGDLFSIEPASLSRVRREKSRSISTMNVVAGPDKKRRRMKKLPSVKLGLSGDVVRHRSTNRVSFEFGLSSSPRMSSRKIPDPKISSESRTLPLNDIKSKLSERSVLFTADPRVKAPTELLNKTRDRKLRKSDES